MSCQCLCIHSMKTVSTATICISPFMSGLSQELHVHPHLPSALPLSEEGTILMSLEDILMSPFPWTPLNSRTVSHVMCHTAPRAGSNMLFWSPEISFWYSLAHSSQDFKSHSLHHAHCMLVCLQALSTVLKSNENANSNCIQEPAAPGWGILHQISWN